MFFLSLGFIYLFIFFNLLNFYPVTRFLVTPLLVTRYCVTLFSNTRLYICLYFFLRLWLPCKLEHLYTFQMRLGINCLCRVCFYGFILAGKLRHVAECT